MSDAVAARSDSGLKKFTFKQSDRTAAVITGARSPESARVLWRPWLGHAARTGHRSGREAPSRVLAGQPGGR
eukprot:5860837-Alexandrium_andersonii.AAC.1